MELEKIYNKLKSNLYKSSILYIPSIDYTEYGIECSDILNKLSVVKEDGAMYFLNRSAILYYASQKSSFLDKNTFLLLDCKKNLTEEEFEFVTLKYKKQLDFTVSVVTWLEENLTTFIDDVNIDVKTSFNIQKEAVFNHAEKVNQITSTPLNLKPFTQSIEDLLDINQELLKEILQSTNTSIKIESKEITSSKRKKKTKPITNEDAEQYLIDTIFKTALPY